MLAHSLFLCTVVLSIVQFVYCGQIFTNGLSIIDAPSANSPAHAGSDLPIAVDVSGDGQLSPDSANPSSNLATHISLLEIYLVSSEASLNVTVSSGTTFLTNETGSVRHLNWPIPSCLPAAQYNLTFYETSQVDGAAHFIITPVPISVQNANPTGNCTQVNPLQAQPQASAPLQQSPFIPTLITVTVSGGGFQFPTITQTVAPVTETMVVISLETTTVTGQQGVMTSVLTQTFTTTAVADTSGFIPINKGISNHLSFPLFYLGLSLCIFILYH